jgi:hypothetical protein
MPDFVVLTPSQKPGFDTRCVIAAGWGFRNRESDMSQMNPHDRGGKPTDRYAQVLSDIVQSLDASGKLRLPRNGYLLKTTPGGKLIVAPLTEAKRVAESAG